MTNVIYLWKIFLISISDWQKIPFIFFKKWWMVSQVLSISAGPEFPITIWYFFFIWCLHGRSKQYYDLSILNPVEFSKEKERNAVSQRDTWTFSPQIHHYGILEDSWSAIRFFKWFLGKNNWILMVFFRRWYCARQILELW